MSFAPAALRRPLRPHPVPHLPPPPPLRGSDGDDDDGGAVEHAASLAATGVPAIVAAFRVVGKEVSGLHKLRVGGCVIGRCKTKAFKNQVYNCKPNDRQKKKNQTHTTTVSGRWSTESRNGGQNKPHK